MLILTDHNVGKYDYLGHFGKNGAQPKTRQKERFLQCGIPQNLTQMYCLSTYVPKNAF